MVGVGLKEGKNGGSTLRGRKNGGDTYAKEKMRRVYLGEEKNGGRTHLRMKSY
jgi:hypothetical protein